MKTSALLKLHQRQVDILDMIVKCNNRIYGKESDIRLIRACTNQKEKWWHEFTRAEENCEIWITRTQAIKQRLIRYYLDIQKRILSMQPTIELNTITEQDLATEKS